MALVALVGNVSLLSNGLQEEVATRSNLSGEIIVQRTVNQQQQSQLSSLEMERERVEVEMVKIDADWRR